MLARAMHMWRDGYKGERVGQTMQLRLPSCCCGYGMRSGGARFVKVFGCSSSEQRCAHVRP